MLKNDCERRVRASLLVAVTGYGQESDRQRSQEAGFDEHVVKPIDFPSLERLLSRASPASATS